MRHHAKQSAFHRATTSACAQQDVWHVRTAEPPEFAASTHQAVHHEQFQLHEHMASSPFAAANSQHRARDSTASISRAAASSSSARLRGMLSSRLLGPASVALVAGYCASLLFAAWRFFIMNRTRACSTCHGYGLTRCDFCQGAGQVQWEGKWGHVDPVRTPCIDLPCNDLPHAGSSFLRHELLCHQDELFK